MDANPIPGTHIVGDETVRHRQMCMLSYETQRDLRSGIARDGESHRIALALRRDAGTGNRITEIAAVREFRRSGLLTLVTGSAAMPTPPCAKRKARRMQPRTLFNFLRRHEERTGQ